MAERCELNSRLKEVEDLTPGLGAVTTLGKLFTPQLLNSVIC